MALEMGRRKGLDWTHFSLGKNHLQPASQPARCQDQTQKGAGILNSVMLSKAGREVESIGGGEANHAQKQELLPCQSCSHGAPGKAGPLCPHRLTRDQRREAVRPSPDYTPLGAFTASGEPKGKKWGYYFTKTLRYAPPAWYRQAT